MTNSEVVSLLMNSQYYKQGYKQGVSDVLDKIRAEIDGAKMPKNQMSFFRDGIDCALRIIDKYKEEIGEGAEE